MELTIPFFMPFNQQMGHGRALSSLRSRQGIIRFG